MYGGDSHDGRADMADERGTCDIVAPLQFSDSCREQLLQDAKDDAERDEGDEEPERDVSDDEKGADDHQAVLKKRLCSEWQQCVHCAHKKQKHS